MLARLAFFLLLIVPPMALAADAPPSAGKITVIRQPPRVAAATPAAAQPLQPAAPAALASTAPADCRMGCAQTYYACGDRDQPGDCSGQWSQCVAACNTPNLAPAFSTAP